MKTISWETQIRISKLSQTRAARNDARRRQSSFRAPHHSVSQAALFAELALSAGGVLLLDGFGQMRPGCFSPFFNVWTRMDHRPVLYLAVEEEAPLPSVHWCAAVKGSAIGGHPAVERIVDDVRVQIAAERLAAVKLQELRARVG